MKNIVLSFLVMMMILPVFGQTKVGGVTMTNEFEFNDQKLVLNGAGIREKYWMNMYVGGLYLPKKTNDAKAIINKDETMMIQLQIVSGLISSKKMNTAVDEGFDKSTNGNTSKLDTRIQQFKNVFKEEIKKGDTYNIIYIPRKGTVVYKNGKMSSTIKGLDFKKALFGIWFGDQPADANLKKAMLGK